MSARLKCMTAILFSLGMLIPLFSSAQSTDGLQANSITVYPASLSFNLEKGGTKTQLVNIKNATDKTYQLNVLMTDFTRDTLGKHIYSDPGTMMQSCSKWISLDRTFLEMAPGTTSSVAVTMKLPDSAEAVSEMKWTMLLVKTVTEKVAPVAGENIAFATTQSMAIGVHIYQTPPGLTYKEVKMTGFSELSGRRGYRVACKNVGAVQLSCEFSMELSSQETGMKTRLESKTIPLFPAQDRYVDFFLPESLPSGHYTLIAMIDAGDDIVPIEAVQKEVTVK